MPVPALLGLLQLLLVLASRGYVSRDFGKADRLACFIGDRVNDDACPEPAAVLPNLPRFGLVSVLTGSDFERPRYPVDLILRKIKDRDMFTHDFLCGVACDALGTQTPVGYVSLPIEHDDREGGDTLDQLSVPLLGLTQSF